MSVRVGDRDDSQCREEAYEPPEVTEYGDVGAVTEQTEKCGEGSDQYYDVQIQHSLRNCTSG